VLPVVVIGLGLAVLVRGMMGGRGRSEDGTASGD
jgi:hypothetical protein